MNNNTTNLGEYIWDNLFYAVIGFIWYKNLLLRCLNDMSYGQSRVVLLSMIIVIGTFGIIVNIGRNRNGSSTFANIAFPFGTYTALAYMSVNRLLFLVVSICAGVISALFAGMIMCRRIKNKKKAGLIFLNRIRQVISQTQFIFAVGLTCAMVILGIGTLVGSSILQPAVIATTCKESDEQTIENNIDVRALIFRLRQSFSLISPYSLIETTPNGYRFNPKLNIMTDLQAFEKLWETVQCTNLVTDKAEILKQAVNMYKGDVLVSAAGEHWLIPTAAHYNLRYLGMMSELLKILAEGKDYHNLHRYAAQALTVNPENETAYYWLIYSMVKMNAIELAKTQLQIAKENLTDEDYFDLVSELKKIDISPTTNLFRNERVNG